MRLLLGTPWGNSFAFTREFYQQMLWLDKYRPLKRKIPV